MSNKKMRFGTKVIHAGIVPDPGTGAIMTPIFQTSTYVQKAPGDHKGYEYARTQNPTRTALELNLASLENGKSAICFSSGMAAMDAIVKLLKSGDEILASNDLYGGSYRLIQRVFNAFGITGRFVDMTNLQNVAENIHSKTKLIWIETPTNPMLSVVDIEAIANLAKKKNILTCVDNTFCSPFLQNPLDFGVDLVSHSATKYINGHSDVVHGCVVTNDDGLAERLKFLQNAAGAVPGPMDCFLVLRGIKTLHVRMQRACENAEKIAYFLKSHPKVSKVYYPGFVDHPNHDVAKKQMRMYGSMISFDPLNQDTPSVNKILSGTKYFALAESLGGVESLMGHPASMTHASIPKEERLRVGLTDSLIRLSVGIEDVDDLIEDLDSCLR